MAINYPTTLDTLNNPLGTDSVVTVNHAQQHSDVNDAIEALQAKIGVDGSAVTGSIDYIINNLANDNIAVGAAIDATKIHDGSVSNTEFGYLNGVTSAIQTQIDAIGAPEGTAVLSTGETGGNKFLREDGDGTSSWQAIPGGGDLLAANNLSDLANFATARTNLGVAIGSDVQAYSAVLDATTASFTTADETKLDGIETGATANDTDANLRDRSTHTGTQTASTISDFDTEVSNNADVTANTAKVGVTTQISNVVEDTTPQLGGDLDAQSNNINTVGDIDYTTSQATVSALGNLGASQAIDWATATHFTGTLDSNVTITHSNEVSGQSVTLYLSYSGAQRTITWSDVDTWLDSADGSAPAAPITTGDELVVTLQFVGTTCYASATGNYAVY